MTKPLISIVLPTYNGARYIRKSIESCLTQSVADFELIIVNDCSTDNTLQIINEYAKSDQRIVVVNNSFNKKLPLSLNTGFELAKGKYFTWTSDDNFYAPNALELMLQVLEYNTSLDLVYTDYTLIDESDNVFGARHFGDINESFNKWLGCGACFLYRKEVHTKNNGYRPEAFLIEDYDFFVRAYLEFNFAYLPRTDLYFYREHSASLTSTQNTFINDVSKLFLEKNLQELEKKLSPKEMKLLYRKFAVYFAVQKNNTEKYKVYLRKLSSFPKAETAKIICYVFFQKTLNAFIVGFTGFFYAIKLFLEKR